MTVPPAISDEQRRGRRSRRRSRRKGPILKHYDPRDMGYKTPCWMFRGPGTNRGYNQVRLPDGTQPMAHRYFYEQLVGPIPPELTLDHLCRVRGCVNPAHLEPVTRGENVLRGEGLSAQNARKTHCKNGHPFDLFNTYIHSNGARRCRICMAESWRS